MNTKIFVFFFLLLLPLSVFSQEDVIPPSLPALPDQVALNADNEQADDIAGDSGTTGREIETEESGVSSAGEKQEQKDADAIYIDFRDTDIREVARVLSKVSGINMIVAEDVKASVTLNIEGVNWKTALDLISKTYNLTYIEKDNFIIIVSYAQIDKEAEKIPLVTKIITINFVNTDDAKSYLKPVMSKRGNIEADKRTNSLIITDTPDNIQQAEEIVKRLDRKTPQVLIELLMVDKKATNQFDLGVDWDWFDIKRGLIHNEPQENGTYKKASSAFLASQTSALDGQNIALQYGKLLWGRAYVSALIEALKKDTSTDILANPRVLTLDNMSAQIDITDQVPYTSETTSDQGTVTSTQFKDVGIKMSVKPHITPDGFIVIDVATEQSFVNYFTSDNQPAIGTRKSQNTMLIKDGETIVIGGLRNREKKKTIYKVPFIGDIPILGKLFSKTLDSDENRELVIFITPSIPKDNMTYAENVSFLQAQANIGELKNKDILPIRKPNE